MVEVVTPAVGIEGHGIVGERGFHLGPCKRSPMVLALNLVMIPSGVEIAQVLGRHTFAALAPTSVRLRGGYGAAPEKISVETRFEHERHAPFYTNPTQRVRFLDGLYAMARLSIRRREIRGNITFMVYL